MDFEYFIILKFFFFCLLISIILFSISFFFVYQQFNLEKLSAYECGFILLVMLDINLKFIII
jgi:NADH:ubiquinone oxidoreductase subunit 3 (subunit A)